MISAAFVMGLLGSMHCAGMCGPLSLLIPARTSGAANRIAGLLFYNLARTGVYALLGMLAGWAGYFISLTGSASWLMLLSGLLLFFSGAFSFFSSNLLDRLPVPAGWMNRLRRIFIPFFSMKNRWAYVGMGAFNALVPCGLLYTALLGAVAQAHPWQSALFMILFGLGTFPAMMAAQYLLHAVKAEWRVYLRKVLPVATIALGLFLVYRSGIIQARFAPETGITQCD